MLQAGAKGGRAAGAHAGMGDGQTRGYSGCSKAALLSCLGQLTSWQIKGTPCARCSCTLERKKKFFVPFLGFLRANSQLGFMSQVQSMNHVPSQEPSSCSLRLRLLSLFQLKVCRSHTTARSPRPIKALTSCFNSKLSPLEFLGQ